MPASETAALDGPAAAHVRALVRRLALQEPDLEGHSDRLALLASIFGVGLGLTEAEITTLRQGAYLHDVGKVGVPSSILRKNGPLTTEEWGIMQQHPVLGEAICRGVPGLEDTLPIIRWHHERWDGSGYPDRLSGENTPLFARIMQLIDIFDALTTERPYRRTDTPQAALAIMQQETARGWRDPALMTEFERFFPLFAAPPAAALDAYSLVALSEAVNRGQWA